MVYAFLQWLVTLWYYSIFSNFVLALLGIDIVIPLVPLDTMMPVLMGMLGLGAMRTYEKKNSVHRNK